MNVLVNAYAVSPSWGSEPGMGWNWIINLAKYCNLYVITEGEWRQDIESDPKYNESRANLHFYYLPASDRIRSMCWNQGDWRFYYYYRIWQKRALVKAMEIMEVTRIDVVHQLNMVGFREPGYLWKLGRPLVWGPIGGLEEVQTGFLSSAPTRMRLFIYLKNVLSSLQLRFDPRINRAFREADVLISAVPEAKRKIESVKHRDSLLIPETGCYDLKTEPEDKRLRPGLHVIWVGKFDFRKRLDIALDAIAKVKHLKDLHFHVVGTGSKKQVDYYKSRAKTLGIDGICEWHGKVDNIKVHEMMKDADLFLFTSISEATSTVVPEAINNCLPVVCFDTCGFGPLVDDRIGRKVRMTNPAQAVDEFAGFLDELYHDKQALYDMSMNCREALKSLLWEEKARMVFDVYSSLVNG